MKKAKLLRDTGRVVESIPIMEEAAGLLDFEREPFLLFGLKKDLILHLSEVGRAEEAQELLPEVRDLARLHGSRLERLRLLWVEGLLRKNRGQVELGAEALKQAREGFIAAQIGYDVALVSLDLADLYLEADRTEEARQLATESIPLFTSRGVHREALMAWNLFREAAERDALTLGLVQEVASRIRQSQSRPAAGGDLA
jgi:tetratricopeptide (TPR) repeat protein